MHRNHQTLERIATRRRAWCHRRRIVTAEYVTRSSFAPPPNVLANMARSVKQCQQPPPDAIDIIAHLATRWTPRNLIRNVYGTYPTIAPLDLTDIEARILAANAAPP